VIVRWWARLYATHLEDEIAYLKKQVEHERQRAEIAIDELLRIRIAAGPVTLPVSPAAPDRAADLVNQILSNEEFHDAGVVE
jgi:hypothetical protein